MTKEERLEDLKNKYRNDSDVQFVSSLNPLLSVNKIVYLAI